MIRWTEQRDGYLARVAPAGGAAVFYLISSFLAVAALLLAMQVATLGAVLCALFAVVFTAIGWSFTGFESWIAVPLRGHRVRWGGRGRQTREGDVTRFELGRSGEAPPFVIARLVDGSSDIAIDTSAFILPRDGDGLVEQLNELLESAAARGV